MYSRTKVSAPMNRATATFINFGTLVLDESVSSSFMNSIGNENAMESEKVRKVKIARMINSHLRMAPPGRLSKNAKVAMPSPNCCI